MAAAKRAEPKALEAIVASCYPRVEQLVHLALTKDLRAHRDWLSTRFSTGDIVQDVFHSLLRELSHFSGTTRDELISYLATSVRHRILDRLRFHEAERRDGRRTHTAPASLDVIDPKGTPLDSAETADEVRHLRVAVRSLEPFLQAVVRMRVQEKATFQKIADRMGFNSMALARKAYYSAIATIAMKLRARTTEAAATRTEAG